ncbi:hypothetical protein, partial [Acidithiobacillus sp.]|uniref:hypothetical protein n=1 Tax=Acidithiobacillus sp. TaxID=1872118 RepID=UPI002613D6CC
KKFDQQTRALQDDLEFLVPEPRQFDNIPTLAELSRDGAAGAEAQSSAGAAGVVESRNQGALQRLGIIEELVARCRDLAAMDFEFLYDTSRGLLAI